VCEPPRRLAATWAYGQPGEARPDEVEVRLASHGEGTLLELEHRSETGAPWAGGVGAGWEAGLMMFDVLFRGDDPATIPVPEAFPKLDGLWTELVDAGG
jgi:Activator of Hsp90 ATPase homolog 1-like protein